MSKVGDLLSINYLGTHTMRKTGAYRVYTQSNYNIGLVMHLLNHSSEAMTLAYLGMLFPTEFDVIVVGGGHAGTEAALASARMGQKTLLLTHNIETLGQMSCNPSIGGIGKGHLVKEVDAMGGAMAIATDESGIQFRILNSSKGPAVRATRAQADRILYKAAIRTRLENQPNLWLFQQAVDDLIVEGERVVGAVTQIGLKFLSRAVVLTAGTFLDGKIHVGLNNYSAGRAGDPPAISLSARLKELKLPQGRLKTGTPPRIDGRTIDFSVMHPCCCFKLSLCNLMLLYNNLRDGGKLFLMRLIFCRFRL